MSEHTDLLADVSSQEDQFEKEMRGYSRRQVDEFVARARSQVRELEDRLARSLDDNERVRQELSSARQAVDEKPAHAEISERVGQILKLADDEAKAQKNRAADEIAALRNDVKQETEKLRNEVKGETDKFRHEAHEQAERMLNAAQEQAENSIASARDEAEKTRNSARAEAERSVTEAHKQADTAVSTAQAQAKQVMDEATARATAIHDGAERRLNLLMSRHTEAIRRLTEIRDVVTGLVAGEAARGSLEDEVNKAVAAAVGSPEGQQAPGGPGRPPAKPHPLTDARHAPGRGVPGGMGQPGPGRDDQNLRRGPGAPRPGDGLRGPAGPAGDPLRVGDPLRGQSAGDPLRGQATGDPLRGQAGPGPGEPGPNTGSRPSAAQRPGNGQPRESGPRENGPLEGRSPEPPPRPDQHREGEAPADPAPKSGTGDGAKHAAGSPQRP